MENRELHFLNDRPLFDRETNRLTRRKMIEGFLELDFDEVVVYYVVSDREERRETSKELSDMGVEPRPVLVPGFSTWHLRIELLQSAYRFLIKKYIFLFFVLYLLRNREAVKYIWGPQATRAAALLRERAGDFVLELDDHMFGNEELIDSIYLKASQYAYRITTVSEKTREDMVERFVESDRIKVLPNTVDTDSFEVEKDRNSLREELDIPIHEFVVTYTGHLYRWKGVETLVEAAERMRTEDLKIMLVGGKDRDIRRFRQLVDEKDLGDAVDVRGYVPREKVPKYQNASDALVVSNRGEGEKSRYYTCPVKLGEYIAAKKPVVISELPSMKNIVKEDEAYFFTPSEPGELAEKLREIQDTSQEDLKLPEKSYERIQSFDWKDRAREAIEGLSPTDLK